jgi:hypothetical protein
MALVFVITSVKKIMNLILWYSVFFFFLRNYIHLSRSSPLSRTWTSNTLHKSSPFNNIVS